MTFSCLEERISAANPIRFINAFVENIALKTLGFDVQTLKADVRPSFDNKIFLKLYLYGYLNGLRSSRKLERECIRNNEMQWLLCGLVPIYHSLSDFRKNNPLGLKKLFKLFVSFLKDADLIAGETIAVDRTKSRAHNSKKANFNQKKIDRHLAYIEEKTQGYLDELAQNDTFEKSIVVTKIQEKIERLKKNKIHHELLEEKLKESAEPQINTTDTYTSPMSQTLKTTGTWHKKTRDRDSYDFNNYRTPAFRECPTKVLCSSRKGGKEIDRSQYADTVEVNSKRYQENQQLMTVI